MSRVVLVSLTNVGVNLTTATGEIINVPIPGWSTLGIDPTTSDSYHEYISSTEAVKVDQVDSKSVVWRNLKEQPYPNMGTDKFSSGVEVTNGSISQVPVLGSVQHYVSESHNYVVNVTIEDGHILHPGVVIRYLHEENGAYVIDTIGLGTGTLGDLNAELKEWVWERNVNNIRLETLIEQQFGVPDYNYAEHPVFPSSLLQGILPDWYVPAANQFLNAPQASSPLVLDLDGDGVEVTKLGIGDNASAVYFDLDNDNFAERTGWVTGGDGLLALDRNANGKIDNQNELFGNTATSADGFANLRTLDSNSDSRITSADSQWNNLRVWIDSDEDGITDTGELRTLSSLGITQVNLNATVLSGVYKNENLVSHSSTFIINGQTRSVEDVWFRNDNRDTVYNDQVNLDVRTLFLPTLKGFGNLKDLHVAMSEDAVLLTLVENFSSSWSLDKLANSAALKSEVEGILFRWAGVQNVTLSPSSPVNMQYAAFMAKLTGVSDYQEFINTLPGRPGPANAVNHSFATAYDALKAQLIIQVADNDFFDSGTSSYNIVAGDITAGIVSAGVVSHLSAEAESLATDTLRLEFWLGVTEVLLQAKEKSEFSTNEVTILDNAIKASLPAYSLETFFDTALSKQASAFPAGTEFSDYLVGTGLSDGINGLGGDDVLYGFGGGDNLHGQDGNDRIFGGHGNDTIYGGLGNDHLEGQEGNDYIDAEDGDDFLSGGHGNDILIGRGGADTISGGAGNDTLNGADGNDTYLYNIGDGLDTIAEFAGVDSIVLGAGYVVADMTLRQSGNDSILVLKGSDAIILRNHNVSPTIESIQFSNGSQVYIFENGFSSTPVINGTQASDTLAGTSSGEIISGFNGDDSISGNSGVDTIFGGGGADSISGDLGDDTLDGGIGDDTYIYNSGDGFDTINDALGNDTLVLGPGYVAADLALRVSGNDLILALKGTDAIRINSYLVNGGIEVVQLSNGTKLYISGSSFSSDPVINGTSAANILNGTSVKETINGLAGNDTLNGNGGNDALFGGDNNDILNGGSGDDLLDGGSGNDTYVYNLGDGFDVITDKSGSDIISIGAGYAPTDVTLRVFGEDLILSLIGTDVIRIKSYQYEGAIERVSFSNGTILYFAENSLTPDIVMKGTSGADSLGGTIGANNRIYGYEGDDILYGWGSVDYLMGGAGNDQYRLTDDGIIIEKENEGHDTIYSNISFVIPENVEDLIFYYNAGNVNGTGNAQNNRIYGSVGDNILAGLGGADILEGRDGDDTYLVDDLEDIVVEYNLEGYSDTIISSVSYAISDNTFVEDLIITGSAISATGNGLDNIITGNDLDNILDGREGGDTMYGGLGDDIYVIDFDYDNVMENENEGIDTIRSLVSGTYYMAPNVENLIFYNDQTIYVLGNDLNNKITGNNIDNYIDGAIGADIMAGGLGNDSYFIDNIGDIVIEKVGEGNEWVHSSISYTLPDNVENLVLTGTAATNGIGNALNNTFNGNSAANTFDGGAGNDSIFGFGGADTFKFSVSSMGSIDTLPDFSLTEQDKIDVAALLIGYVHGTSSISSFVEITNSGSNSIVRIDRDGSGSAYSWSQIATMWNITNITDEAALAAQGRLIVANAGPAPIDGTSGNDNLSGTANADVMNGYGGDDLLNGLNGDDTLHGHGGNDYLYGAGGNDYLYGDEGDDTLDGASGADTMHGGSGNDVYFIDNVGDVVVELAGGGSDTVWTSISYVAAAEIENLRVFDGTNSNITGNSGNNNIWGNAGSNILAGGNGNDTLYGLGGNDTLNGGTGDDIYVFNVGDGADFIAENASEGMDTIRLIGLTAAQISVVRVSSGNIQISNTLNSGDLITINANASINGGVITNDRVERILLDDSTIIYLDGSSPSINGTSGNDNLSGTANADVMNGYGGDDLLNGLNGDDTLHGHGGNDYLYGAGGNDYLYGDEGDDTLDGASGADLMTGGSGNDTYFIDNVGDVVVEVAGGGSDTVWSSISYVAASEIENLRVYNGSNINMTGNSGNNNIWGQGGANILAGGDGNDTLYGQDGDDTLIGDAGSDTLNGGSGADTFKFATSTVGSVDTIADFNISQGDKIDISDLLFGYDPLTDLITDFVEITTSGSNSVMKVDQDGSGSAHAMTQIATINNVTGLTDENALVTSGTLIV